MESLFGLEWHGSPTVPMPSGGTVIPEKHRNKIFIFTCEGLSFVIEDFMNIDGNTRSQQDQQLFLGTKYITNVLTRRMSSL